VVEVVDGDGESRAWKNDDDMDSKSMFCDANANGRQEKNLVERFFKRKIGWHCPYFYIQGSDPV